MECLRFRHRHTKDHRINRSTRTCQRQRVLVGYVYGGQEGPSAGCAKLLLRHVDGGNGSDNKLGRVLLDGLAR